MSHFKIDALPTKHKSKVLPSPHQGILPSHPARVMFSGSSGSGKTNLILQLISNKKFLKGYFDLIFLFSPTGLVDDVFDAVIPKIIKKKHVFDKPDPDVLQQLFDKQTAFVKEHGIDKAARLLVILDDIIDNKTVMNSKPLSQLFFRGRHIGISVWVSTQSYNKVPRALRMQLSNAIIFKPKKSEMKVICADACPGHLEHKEFEKLINYATAERYNFCHLFFEIDKDKMIRKNFDKLLNIK